MTGMTGHRMYMPGSLPGPCPLRRCGVLGGCGVVFAAATVFAATGVFGCEPVGGLLFHGAYPPHPRNGGFGSVGTWDPAFSPENPAVRCWGVGGLGV
jgi:hypothetical protein